MKGRSNRRPLLVLAVVALCATMVVGPGGSAAAAPKKPLAENVIVMIADGWGFNHDLAGSYYATGGGFGRVWNDFPTDLAMSTYQDYESGSACYGVGYDPTLAWASFDWLASCYTDSSAAATTMSSGVKTYDGAIGVDMDQNPVLHVSEAAEAMGKSTGVVTSVQWTHATPAGFVTHNVSRNDYAGIGYSMIYDSAVDVVMGGGHPFYGHSGELLPGPYDFRYVGGESTWDGLVAGTAGGDADGDGDPDPWTLIQTRAEFQSLAEGPTPARVLGTAQVAQTLQYSRGGDADADTYVVPFIDTVPTLEEMTRAALNILDDDPDGFFLMVEGGAIDWASHANRSGRMLEEELAFQDAVEAVMAWIDANSNWGETLLIVTADHETGYLTGPGSDPSWSLPVNNGVGTVPGMEWHSTQHTNNLVPFFAKGDAARLFKAYADQYDPVYGRYLDNAEMGKALFRVLDPRS